MYTSPKFLIRAFAVDEDRGTGWVQVIGCAHTLRGAKAAADRLNKKYPWSEGYDFVEIDGDGHVIRQPLPTYDHGDEIPF